MKVKQVLIILTIVIIVLLIIFISRYTRELEKSINFDVLKTCSSNEECVIVNSLNKCSYCDRDDICGEIDYSKSKYIAINSELFFKWQTENCPSKEECLEKYGPPPACPVTEINVNFEAKCVDNTCKKVPK